MNYKYKARLAKLGYDFSNVTIDETMHELNVPVLIISFANINKVLNGIPRGDMSLPLSTVGSGAALSVLTVGTLAAGILTLDGIQGMSTPLSSHIAAENNRAIARRWLNFHCKSTCILKDKLAVVIIPTTIVYIYICACIYLSGRLN